MRFTHINIIRYPLLLTLFLGLFGISYAQQSGILILAGYKSVPSVNTAANGTVEVTLKGDSLSVEGSFSDLSNYYYGSSIFYGEEGTQGNQLFNLDPDINEDRISGTFKTSKNTFRLNEAQLEALANGNLYLSILSYDHKRGELRAQIPPLKQK